MGASLKRARTRDEEEDCIMTGSILNHPAGLPVWLFAIFLHFLSSHSYFMHRLIRPVQTSSETKRGGTLRAP